MQKKSVSLLSLIFAGTLLIPTSTRTDNWSDFGKGLAVVGAAAVAVGATVWALNQEESDADLIARAEKTYNREVMTLLTTSAQELLPYSDLFYTMPEYQVEQISVSLFKKMTLGNLIENSIFAVEINTELIDKLTTRIYKKNKNYNRAEASIIRSMEILVSKLEKRNTLIEKTIKQFLTYHRSYLELFEYEQKLHKHCADEFGILSYYSKSIDTQDAIKRVLYNKFAGYKYPYSAALDAVKDNLATLTRLLNKLTRSYPQREKMAYWIKEQLEYMRSVINASPELERENIRKEREALEKKQRELEIKQREIELEHQKMLIAQKNEQIRLHAKQMEELKKERKKLEKLQDKLGKRVQ